MIDIKRTIYDDLLEWKNFHSEYTLELHGSRQSGKTYILNKFADEQYQYKVYISMSEISGEKFLKCIHHIKESFKINDEYNFCKTIFELYDLNFIDNEETIIIIDEIQESNEVYNLIRQFTRYLKSNVVVTGSYLGKTLSNEFWTPTGDIYNLTITTLSFEEFALVAGTEITNIDLYGNSEKESYQKLQSLFKIYTTIGGYPAVVKEYIATHSIDKSVLILENIIELFCNESKRYFTDILDISIFNDIFCSITRILLKEKKGLDSSSLNEELQKLIVHDYTSNINKTICNRAINWIYHSGIIGYCGKVIDCNPLDFKPRNRCYFMDLGITNYYCRKIGANKENMIGLLNENFVYLELYKRTRRLKEIAFETPAFAVDGDGELDFFVKSLLDERKYGIEVKSGKDSGNTARRVLKNKKIDYLVYTKGDTLGGIKDNIYTIPIYLFSKFIFDVNKNKSIISENL